MISKTCFMAFLGLKFYFLMQALNSKFNAIPKKITIGKRLAQCMHPALPGGVHLKALEVYNTIFNILEPKRLKSDLYIYR